MSVTCSILTFRRISEDYVHRIGRTGRAGRSGTAITLVTPEDKKYVDQIEALIGKEVEWEGPKLSELPPPLEAPRSHERRGGERGARRGGGERTVADEAGLLPSPNAMPRLRLCVHQFGVTLKSSRRRAPRVRQPMANVVTAVRALRKMTGRQ